MKAKDKKGIELAINLIIIAAIGILILILAVAFIMKVNSQLHVQVPRIREIADALWEPTTDKPVIIKPYELDLKRGKSDYVTLQVYNYADTDVLCNIGFSPNEGTPDDAAEFLYYKTNTELPVGKIGEWKINVKAPKASMPGFYLFIASIDCGEFSEKSELFITVR